MDTDWLFGPRKGPAKPVREVEVSAACTDHMRVMGVPHPYDPPTKQLPLPATEAEAEAAAKAMCRHFCGGEM